MSLKFKERKGELVARKEKSGGGRGWDQAGSSGGVLRWEWVWEGGGGGGASVAV
jgi:hypothetical protein